MVLADRGPSGETTFAISHSFNWKSVGEDQLVMVAIDARGPNDQQTTVNNALFRAALSCA